MQRYITFMWYSSYLYSTTNINKMHILYSINIKNVYTIYMLPSSTIHYYYIN